MDKSIIENSMVAYLGHEDNPDISNPIHSTEIAKAYGFPGPLIGGVTVWGWSTDTILEALGNKWLDVGWAEYSFRQPTFPGEKIKIRGTNNDLNNTWTIEIINESNIVCVIGEVGIGKAMWADEFINSKSMNPTIESDIKPGLSLENTKTNIDWNAMQVTFNEEVSSQFTSEKQITNNPLFVGRSKIAHPSWIAGWAEQLMRHNFTIPTSMHTKSRVQHIKSIPKDTVVIGGAHIIEVYEKKAHHFVNFDVILQDIKGDYLAQLRHWTIFKIATIEERESL